jgi:threonine dehydrogenase-like Zn-dependent dehydrogenase
VISDPVASRRALGEALGADATVDPVAGSLREVCSSELGGAPPVVMECSGKAGLIEQAMRVAAVEGRVGVVGACLGSDAFTPYTGMMKEIDVRFSVYYDSQDFIDTLKALDHGSLVVEGLITEVIDLEALPATFAKLLAGADTGKVVVVP